MSCKIYRFTQQRQNVMILVHYLRKRCTGVLRPEILYELSWLWEMMGIAMAAAVVCVACAALICKAAKKKLSRKVIAVVAAAAFAGAVLAVILIARTPMPL